MPPHICNLHKLRDIYAEKYHPDYNVNCKVATKSQIKRKKKYGSFEPVDHDLIRCLLGEDENDDVSKLKKSLSHGANANICINDTLLLAKFLSLALRSYQTVSVYPLDILYLAKYSQRARKTITQITRLRNEIEKDTLDALDLLLLYECNPSSLDGNISRNIVLFLQYNFAQNNESNPTLLNLLIKIHGQCSKSRHYVPNVLSTIKDVNLSNNHFVKQALSRDCEIIIKSRGQKVISAVLPLMTGQEKTIVERIIIGSSAFASDSSDTCCKQMIIHKSTIVSQLSLPLRKYLFDHVFLPNFVLDESKSNREKARLEFDDKFSNHERIIDLFYIKDHDGNYRIEGYNIWEVRYDINKPGILMHYIISTVVNIGKFNIERYTSLFVFRACIALQYRFPTLNVISIFETLNPVTIMMVWLFFNSHRYAVAHIYFNLLQTLIENFVGDTSKLLEYENGQFYRYKQSVRGLDLCNRYRFMRREDFLLKSNTNILVFFEASLEALLSIMNKSAPQHVVLDAVNNYVEALNYLLPSEILRLAPLDLKTSDTSLKAKL